MALNEFNKKMKVAVVGAGPSGSITAYLMSLKGHEVTLFERKREIERKVCGEYLCPEGVALLSRLDILKNVAPHFQELHGMVLNSPSGLSIQSFFPDNKKNIKNGLSLNRKEFDKNLINLALVSGVTFLKDFQVTKVELNSKKCWEIIANDEYFEFDLLIAADGRQSKIGNLLSHVCPIDTKQVAIHCYLPRKIDRGLRLGEMHIMTDNRYCGLNPINDDEVNFSVVCDAERLKSSSALAIINDVIKDSNRLSEMFDMIDHNVELKIVTSLKNKSHFIAGNKLAYVGDASGFIDPLTGEGIYNALLSGYLLVDSLSKTSTINEGLHLYKIKKKQQDFQKNVLNHFFQFLIKYPLLVNLFGNFLNKSPKRANHFIGNIHGPIEGLLRMLFHKEVS